MNRLLIVCYLDPRHYEYILSQPSFRQDIVECLTISHTKNTQINAMTALIQLVTTENYQSKKYKLFFYQFDLMRYIVILTEDLEKHLQRIRNEYQETQASMMATMILTDFYHHTF